MTLGMMAEEWREFQRWAQGDRVIGDAWLGRAEKVCCVHKTCFDFRIYQAQG